ncbi:ATP-binding protein [Anaerosporobacter sp.]|uniref:ATP-binding protein n=1 Tax=Anaerosporobacter sp. TaxID=1872529 RepID=UPI00286EBFB8|nr:ATP-binding protein [Anaerosporobacter sp.]
MMKFLKIIKSLINGKTDFRLKIFYILAMVGIGLSFLMTIFSIIADAQETQIILNMSAGIFAIILLAITYKTKKYKMSYILVCIIVFMIGFGAFFISGGGYYSSMPSFFIFAVVFTMFMIDGVAMLLCVSAELGIYIGLCIFAYLHPEYIIWIGDEKEIVIDIIIGVLITSLALGLSISLQLYAYKEQQKLLEKTRQEAVQANLAKSAFLANMSHEIRTPIYVMLGMTEMMLLRSKEAYIIDYAKKSKKAGNVLLTLVDDILDISKIENEKLDIVCVAYNIEDLFQETTIIGKELAKKKGLIFQAELEETIPKVLVGDVTRIRQIIINLINNAVKYTNEGKVVYQVNYHKHEEGRIELIISVSDTGVGIHEKDMEKIFSNFVQINTVENKGAGIGLAIVKKLTELMNGEITVKSQLGEGSRFCIKIPLETRIDGEKHVEQRELQNKESVEISEIENIAIPGAKILVVDDNNDNLMVTKELLNYMEIQVELAHSGLECIEKLIDNTYDMIFMDYMMPDMNGEETLQYIKNRHKDFTTPVIAFTADVISGVREKLLAAGFSDYMAKPIQMTRLKHILLEHLSKEQLVTETRSEMREEEQLKVKEWQEKLIVYGVDLNMGLKLYQHDRRLYCKCAELFVEYYYENIKNLTDHLENEDWDKLYYEVHTLKSRAKSVGATMLAEDAVRMEQALKGKDYSLVSAMKELAYLEYKRVYQGLTLLLAK